MTTIELGGSVRLPVFRYRVIVRVSRDAGARDRQASVDQRHTSKGHGVAVLFLHGLPRVDALLLVRAGVHG